MTGSSDAILTFLSLKEKLWLFLQYSRQFHGKCWFPSQATAGQDRKEQDIFACRCGMNVMDLYVLTVNKTAVKDTA